ncbi:MAG: nucleoside deaminase [Thermodesulfovibrionales bacterium]|nr:nucleoside deaminase [Thermodesulfovibrionales bacterium]
MNVLKDKINIPSLFFLCILFLLKACSSDTSQVCLNCVKSAEEAAKIALNMAQEANANGTFGVGGAIIENKTGRVIVSLRNHVLEPLNPAVQIKEGETYTFDPTAHGERQLVYWYYQNRFALNLPHPSELTIVTSLDPCAMCTGTLLAAGFNVAVVALDDWAGINYNGNFDFPGLPSSLKAMLQSRFGYYAVDNIRRYVGSNSVIFKDNSISKSTLDASLSVFLDNVQKIRDNSQGSGVDPMYLIDPFNLPDNSPIKRAFREAYPKAFTYKVANFRLPDETIKNILIELKENAPLAKNAVAFIDPFGNLVLATADTFTNNPVATAYMNLIQQYSKIRFSLVNNPQTTEQARRTLTHPKYGTIVFLYAPDPTDVLTLQILGAYGSTMEGPIPQTEPSNFQYYYPPQNGTIEELLNLISNLPPFYTKTVGISPQQVK